MKVWALHINAKQTLQINSGINESHINYNMVYSLSPQAANICTSSLLAAGILINVPLTSWLTCIYTNKVSELEHDPKMNSCTFLLTMIKMPWNYNVFFFFAGICILKSSCLFKVENHPPPPSQMKLSIKAAGGVKANKELIAYFNLCKCTLEWQHVAGFQHLSQ